MAKKNGWDADAMQGTLISDMEQEVREGVSQMQPVEPVQEITAKRKWHKELKQDALVHCPISLHRKLKELKDRRWDEDGVRVNINDMIVEAIADWLDKQEDNKVT